MEPLKIITNKEEIDLTKNVLAQIKELRVMDGNGNKNLNDQLLGIYKLEDLKRKIDQLVASVEEKYHIENPNPEYVFVESPSNSDSKSNAKKRKIATNKISSLSALSKPSAIAPKTVINSSISPPANIHAKGKPLCAVLVDKEWILGYVISEGKGSKKTCEIADYDNHTQKYIVSINNMIKLTNNISIKETKIHIDKKISKKTKIEFNNIKLCHIQDGISLTKFILQSRNNNKSFKDEYTIADKLYKLRK